MPTQDAFTGGLLGLALGDALGAPFEGGVLERLAWRVLGRTRRGELRWTDDTQMSLDVAESLISCGKIDADDLAQRFAAGYRWSRGYGPGAAKLLKRIRTGQRWQDVNRAVFKDGSYGNGGAMRSPVIGLFCANQPDTLASAVREATVVTHAHPLAIEGAVMIATTVAAATRSASPGELMDAAAQVCVHDEFVTRLQIARDWLKSPVTPSPAEVGKQLGRGIAAPQSCVSAVYLAARFLDQPFLEMVAFITKMGGDTDTIAAMAGAIWGTCHGGTKLPQAVLEKLEQRDRIEQVARDLYRLTV